MNPWIEWRKNPQHYPYPQSYLYEVSKAKATLFGALAQKEWPGGNIDHFIDWFHHSKLQARMDSGEVRSMTLRATEMLAVVKDEGYTPVYTRPTLTGDAPHWAGRLYTFYQWEFNVPSAEVIEWMPPCVVSVLFPTWHEVSLTLLAKEYPFGCDHGYKGAIAAHNVGGNRWE